MVILTSFFSSAFPGEGGGEGSGRHDYSPFSYGVEVSFTDKPAEVIFPVLFIKGVAELSFLGDCVVDVKSATFNHLESCNLLLPSSYVFRHP